MKFKDQHGARVGAPNTCKFKLIPNSHRAWLSSQGQHRTQAHHGNGCCHPELQEPWQSPLNNECLLCTLCGRAQCGSPRICQQTSDALHHSGTHHPVGESYHQSQGRLCCSSANTNLLFYSFFLFQVPVQTPSINSPPSILSIQYVVTTMRNKWQEIWRVVGWY